MIVVDELFDTTPFTNEQTPRCFRNTLSSHMMTTLQGEPGKAELIAFAKRLGLRADWIQYPGTPRQHFDLVASKRAMAVRLGAVEVGRTWRSGDQVQPIGRPWTVLHVTDQLSLAIEHVTAASAREALELCPSALQMFEGEFGGDAVMVIEGHLHDALGADGLPSRKEEP